MRVLGFAREPGNQETGLRGRCRRWPFPRILSSRRRSRVRPSPRSEVGTRSVTAAMPCHRSWQFALIAYRPLRHLAVALRHALPEHKIGRHPRHGGGVLPADLLNRGRVVVRLARPLRKHRATCVEEDDCSENGSQTSAPAGPSRRQTRPGFFLKHHSHGLVGAGRARNTPLIT